MRVCAPIRKEEGGVRGAQVTLEHANDMAKIRVGLLE